MNLSFSEQYNFWTRFYRLAFINMLSGIVVPLSGLVDLAFLGHLSDIRYLAGVALATILFGYLYKILNFLRSSSNGMTAQAVGAENQEAIILVLMRNALIALGLGILILILQYPFQKIGFTFLIGTAEVQDAALDYFKTRIWGAPAVLLNFVLIGWLFGRELNGFVVLLSVLEGLTNIVLDYLFIIRWGWGSAGAGLTTAMSQYLGLLVGLIIVCFYIDWSVVSVVSKKVLNWSAIQATFKLNGNLFIKSLAGVSIFAIFTELSSAMGTDILAQNSVLIHAAFFDMFIVQGVGYATQSLTGNFKGQGNIEQLKPLITLALFTSIVLSVPVAILYMLFPENIFGLLTNHTEVIEHILNYVFWLLPCQGFCAISLILEGYFVGLTDGKTLRNSALISFGLGFVPIAMAALYFQSNQLLWFAFVSSQVVSVIVFGLRLIEEFENQTTAPSSVEIP